MNGENIKKYLVKKKIVGELAAIRRSLSTVHLEESPLDCLFYLGAYDCTSDSEGATKGELRTGLGETRDITRATRKLKDMGLIHDQVGEEDRRERRIKLTAEGEKLYASILRS